MLVVFFEWERHSVWHTNSKIDVTPTVSQSRGWGCLTYACLAQRRNKGSSGGQKRAQTLRLKTSNIAYIWKIRSSYRYRLEGIFQKVFGPLVHIVSWRNKENRLYRWFFRIKFQGWRYWYANFSSLYIQFQMTRKIAKMMFFIHVSLNKFFFPGDRWADRKRNSSGRLLVVMC